ncbi:MAG: YjgN family protein [Salibacteraceae bacterium]
MENETTQPSENSNQENIDLPSKTTKNYQIKFHGSYLQYLGIALYNLLLTVITLGIYYPWAKCAIRQFLWQETELDNSRFEWHGTGKEMFRGFIKAYLIFGSLIFLINFGPLFIPPKVFIWVVLICYLAIIALIPIAIHGMMRYRLSRTSLKGIRFGYRGNLKEFYKQTSLDLLFTIISFGIYASWFQVNMRKFLMKNSKYGNVSAKFDATGGDLFLLSIVQGFLVLITFYIYLPWAIIKFYNFYIDNTQIVKNGTSYRLKSKAKGGQYFIVLIKAFLLTILTLGIAGPIAELMIHKYMIESIWISGKFNFEDIHQTEEAYTDATGDDMMDILDIDF